MIHVLGGTIDVLEGGRANVRTYRTTACGLLLDYPHVVALELTRDKRVLAPVPHGDVVTIGSHPTVTCEACQAWIGAPRSGGLGMLTTAAPVHLHTWTLGAPDQLLYITLCGLPQRKDVKSFSVHEYRLWPTGVDITCEGCRAKMAQEALERASG